MSRDNDPTEAEFPLDEGDRAGEPDVPREGDGSPQRAAGEPEAQAQPGAQTESGTEPGAEPGALRRGGPTPVGIADATHPRRLRAPAGSARAPTA